MRPDFSLDEAQRIVRERYGMSCSLRELPSYIDQNFLVESGSDRRYVLKIAHAAESRAALDFQQKALQHLERAAPDLGCPRHVAPPEAAEGRRSITVTKGRSDHAVWMVSYLPGRFLAAFSSHPPELLFSLGRFLGRLDKALEPYRHPAMHRFIQWDLKQAVHLQDYLQDIASAGRRRLIAVAIQRFVRQVQPALETLRMSVIHNDGNDHNVLAGEEADGWRVSGLIDFGDIVRTYTICELAIAMAYVVLGKTDVLEAVVPVLQGYHQTHGLYPEEIDVLFDLVCIRLATSVCMSARQRKKQPANAYLTVSEGLAWETLERMIEMNARDAAAYFQNAVGKTPGGKSRETDRTQ